MVAHYIRNLASTQQAGLQQKFWAAWVIGCCLRLGCDMQDLQVQVIGLQGLCTMTFASAHWHERP